jgi:hypothetical protein
MFYHWVGGTFSRRRDEVGVDAEEPHEGVKRPGHRTDPI